MKISVNKYTLTPDTVDGGTAGSHGLESLEFDFSPEWDELSRTVTFFPPKSAAKCVSFTGSTLPIPAAVTARAGKVAFVLCGAKDGMAVITVTGVISLCPTMLPTTEETEEHIPGALEQATLLCAEARADAQSAAASAQSALQAADSVAGTVDEVASHRNVVSDLYDEIMDGTAVHAKLTEANRHDRTHPVSVAGISERLDAILEVLSPFNIKAVDELPDIPDVSCIYIYNNKPMVYNQLKGEVTYYKWMPTYIMGGGPAYLYTRESSITVGKDAYWSANTVPTQESDLERYDEVSSDDNGEYGCSFVNSLFTVISNGTVSLKPLSAEYMWRDITIDTDLTPYLRDSAMRYLITGGAS